MNTNWWEEGDRETAVKARALRKQKEKRNPVGPTEKAEGNVALEGAALLSFLFTHFYLV